MALQRVKTKWQLVLFGWGVTGLLGFYTLGALWEYVGTLKAENGWMLKVGFCADLLAIGVWVWFHVFRKWRVTRLWCLTAASVMGIFLVVHAAAITKYVAAKKDAAVGVSTLSTGLAEITKASTEGIVSGTGQVATQLRQQGAPRSANKAVQGGQQAGAQVGVQNGQILADTTVKMEEQARSATFLSPDYLNGKMFAVIYIVLLVLVGITFFVFEMGKAEEDDDDDGIPNFADIDSAHYDANRAEKWWKDRGQVAPHMQKPVEPPRQYFAPPAPAPMTARNNNFTFPDPKTSPRP